MTFRSPAAARGLRFLLAAALGSTLVAAGIGDAVAAQAPAAQSIAAQAPAAQPIAAQPIAAQPSTAQSPAGTVPATARGAALPAAAAQQVLPAVTGTGTAADPYLIATEADLALLAQHPSAAFTLTADVTLTAPWTPVATFTGTLDGNGYAIHGLSVTGTSSTAFVVTNNGTIRRLGFVDATATITGAYVQANRVAVVAVTNNGTIDQVWLDGASVSGGWRAAPVTAENNGQVTNSYTLDADVRANWEAGALIAWSAASGVQRNNYVAGANVRADVQNGAILLGYGSAGTQVTGNVIVSGAVQTTNTPNGRIVARENGAPTYSDNLSLATATVNGATVSGGTATNRQGLDTTAAELAQQATYEAIGWDFATVWTFDDTAGRPSLRVQDHTPAAVDLAAQVVTASPDGDTVATVYTTAEGDLGYTVSQDGAVVVRDSELGLVVGGIDWGAGVTLGTATTSSVDETYPLSGFHDTGSDHHNASVIPVVRGEGGDSDVSVEIRVFDTGIALRYVLDPSLAGALVTREDTTFAFDPSSVLDYQVVTSGTIDDLQNSFSRNTFTAAGAQNITVLATVELAGGHYANVTEANVRDWPAIALRTAPTGVISTYYWATDNGQGTFTVNPATTASPFRVITLAGDLTDFTSSDIVTAVNPPMDPVLFPGGDTSWIETGTNSWSTLSTGNQSYTGIRSLIDGASAAKIPFVLIEGNLADASWGADTAARFANLATLVQYGQGLDFPVKIWLWTDYDNGAGADASFRATITYDSGSPYPQNSLQNPDFRDAYLDLVAATGVVGLKVDHTNEETETKVNFFGDFARASAERHLMVIYHNPLEPTGQNRTYPNELGREAIKGLQSGYDANQNVLAPFTRLIAGPADYTPFLLSGSGGNVTWAHQLASTVVYSMPYLQLSEQPQYIAPGGQYHAVVGDVIANLPTTWTRSWVLPQSSIGGLAGFVRETADGEYWIAITAGTAAPGQLAIPLDFLPAGTTYHADVFTDRLAGKAMDRTTTTVDSTTTLTPALLSGGGFLARITTDPIDSPGGGTGADTYDIATEADLALVAQHPTSTFNLTADITLTQPWTPVATFDGVLEGHGHTIHGLTVEGGAAKAFVVTNNGAIRQLGFSDATSVVTGAYVQSTRVAIVAVVNNGLIDQVEVAGSTVSGGWRSAPITAENNGVVSNSYTVDAHVVANWEAGGLVAWSAAGSTVLNSYVVGADVRADVQNGAIHTGYGYAGTQITGNVIISGTVQTTNDPRGRILARENGTPTYTNNLSYEGALVNGAVVTGGTLSNRQGLDTTAAELTQQATYEAIGWDFTGIWTLDPELGRPVLTAVPEGGGPTAPPADIPEAPVPVLMALLGLATIGGLAALGSRRRRTATA